MILPHLGHSLLAASVILLVACASTSTPPAADAGATCTDGVKCDLVVYSDNTCYGANGKSCACTKQGVVSCSPSFVTSNCNCNTPCATEGNYCTACGGSFTTCQCISGSWTVTHGVMCGFDGGGD